MSENKILTTRLTEDMKHVLKNIRRGMELVRHSDGSYYLVTAANSCLVNARAAKGLIKRGLVELDHDLMRMKWYSLTELGLSISI